MLDGLLTYQLMWIFKGVVATEWSLTSAREQ